MLTKAVVTLSPSLNQSTSAMNAIKLSNKPIIKVDIAAKDVQSKFSANEFILSPSDSPNPVQSKVKARSLIKLNAVFNPSASKVPSFAHSIEAMTKLRPPAID